MENQFKVLKNNYLNNNLKQWT